MVETIALFVGFVTNTTAFLYWNSGGAVNKILKGVFLASAIFFGYLALKTLGI